MAEVPLLVAQVVVIAKTGDVGAGCFEVVVGLKRKPIVKVIVRGEALMIVNPMVESRRELIGIVGSNRNDLIQVCSDIGRRNEFLKQVGSDRVLARGGN